MYGKNMRACVCASVCSGMASIPATTMSRTTQVWITPTNLSEFFKIYFYFLFVFETSHMSLCMKQLTYAQVRFPERVPDSWLLLARAIGEGTDSE